MGQVLSLINSVWESFTLPYKAAIVASFILWLRLQRNRLPGIIIYAVFTLVFTLLKRVAGIKVHPRWSVQQEVATNVLRYVVDCDMEHVSSLLAVAPTLIPHKFTPRLVKTPAFSAHWYGVEDPEAKILLFIHGGGYVMGHSLGYIEAFDQLLDAFARRGVSCAIFSVEYSLSPGAAFPTAAGQVVAAYEYLLKNLSVSPNRIIVGGDSAGGALTLALAYQIRESLPPPAALWLISPWVDSRNLDRFLISPNLKYDYLTPSFLKKGITAYLQNHQQNHLSSPCLGNTQGLPKMYITVGGKEIFRNDIHDFAQKVARENGADSVEIYEHPDFNHDFILFSNLFGKEVLVGMEKSAEFMSTIFKLAD